MRNRGYKKVKYYWGKAWYLDGYYHREDGPAVERPKTKSWYLYGQIYTKQEYFKKLEKLKGKEHTDRIRLIYA